MENTEYYSGQALTYKGKGFLGYDKSDKFMIFIEPAGQFDMYVKYKGNPMLVSQWEVKPK